MKYKEKFHVDRFARNLCNLVVSSHKFFILIVVCCGFSFLFPSGVEAQQTIAIPEINIQIGPGTGEGVANSLQILLLLAILSLAPSLIIMLTSFVRIIIVFLFIKRGLSTQEMPPNQVLYALALFLTFYVMGPTFHEFYYEAYLPFQEQKLTLSEFGEKAFRPFQKFMLKETRPKDVALMVHLYKSKSTNTFRSPKDVPFHILVPAFILSEITTAFKIGIYIFIPFLVIDLIVSSILMSMGMIMLPPVMVSLPLKIILFVVVDGWHLITLSLLRSF